MRIVDVDAHFEPPERWVDDFPGWARGSRTCCPNPTLGCPEV